MRRQQFVKCDVFLFERLIPVQRHHALSSVFNKNNSVEQTFDALWQQKIVEKFRSNQLPLGNDHGVSLDGSGRSRTDAWPDRVDGMEIFQIFFGHRRVNPDSKPPAFGWGAALLSNAR